MARPAQIEQLWSVTGGELKRKKSWIVTTKEVDGCIFFKVDKWNRSFVSFCTGKPLQLQAHKDSCSRGMLPYEDWRL